MANFDRFRWARAVRAELDIPAKAKVVAQVIAEHVNVSTGIAFPSYVTIAREAGIPARTVRRMIEVLCDLGWLEVTQRGSKGAGEKHATHYRIVLAKTATQDGSFAGEKTATQVAVSPQAVRPAKTAILDTKTATQVAMNHSNHRGETAKAVSLSVVEIEEIQTTSPRVERGTETVFVEERAVPQAGESAPVGASPSGSSSTIRTECKPTGTGEQDRIYPCSAGDAVTARASNGEESNMREEMQRRQFERLVKFYPKDRIGDDLENCYDAFDMALTYHPLAKLIEGAINLSLAADRGEEVPELVEFLVSKIGITTLAA
ncbi:helix-turn-helix domain-containing protein [Bradyrhizobium zhanjiangense]|uniref:Helix-turn-helix domain-containing protein n=1 Tax=Bradyrhizobium zhanjiangense TaxID=1325107 RepID=A0A4Q0SQZ4_9BRAD|nr:helix-turn-helix domain-containing protein [Bradyrhizobium zhanjiangense]RXH41078.1 hypothetical protein XH94_09555 [Bradyrhizobium zhanjiangense]